MEVQTYKFTLDFLEIEFFTEENPTAQTMHQVSSYYHYTTAILITT